MIDKNQLPGTSTIEARAIDYVGHTSSDSITVNVVYGDHEIFYVVDRLGKISQLDQNLNSIGEVYTDFSILPNGNSTVRDAGMYPNGNKFYMAIFDTWNWREGLGILNLDDMNYNFVWGDEWEESETLMFTESRGIPYAMIIPVRTDSGASISNFRLDNETFLWGLDVYMNYPQGAVMTKDGNTLYATERNNEFLIKCTNADFLNNNYNYYNIIDNDYETTALGILPDDSALFIGVRHYPSNSFQILKFNTSSFDYNNLDRNGINMEASVYNIVCANINGNAKVFAAMPSINKIAVINPETKAIETSWNVITPEKMKVDEDKGIMYVISKNNGSISIVDLATGSVIAQNVIPGAIDIINYIKSNFPDITIPSIAMTYPQNGDSFAEGHLLSLQFEGNDNRGIKEYQLFINNRYVTSLPASNNTFDLRLPMIDEDSISYKMEMRAIDRSGNMTCSTPVTITIVNDTEAPVLTIHSPSQDDKVMGGGYINVSASATDNSGTANMIAGFEIYLDNDLITNIQADSTGSFATNIPIPSGKYSDPLQLGVVAVDYAGNSSDRAIVALNLVLDMNPTAYHTQNTKYHSTVVGGKMYVSMYNMLQIFNLNSYQGSEMCEMAFPESEINVDYPGFMKYFAVEGNYIYGVTSTEYNNNIPSRFQIYSVTESIVSGGLRGEYYNNSDFSNRVFTRIDPVLDYDYDVDSSPLNGVQGGTYSIRWTGKIKIDQEDTYTFYLASDDGSRMWIDGKFIIDNWSIHGREERSGEIYLTPGFHDIVIEFYQNEGAANFSAYWSSPSIDKQVLPADHLYSVTDNITKVFDQQISVSRGLDTDIEGKIIVNGSKAFISTNDRIIVFDITVPEHAYELAPIIDTEGCIAMESNVSYLFTLSRFGTLKAYNLIDRSLAATVALYAPVYDEGERINANYGDIELLDGMIYATDNVNGLVYVNVVDNPFQMVVGGTIQLSNMSGNPIAIDVDGKMAIVSDGNNGVLVDISTLGSEIEYPVGNMFYGGWIKECYIYGNKIVFQSYVSYVVTLRYFNLEPLSVQLDMPVEEEENHYMTGSCVDIPYILTGTSPTVELLVDGKAVSVTNDTGKYFARYLLPITTEPMEIAVSARSIDVCGNIAVSDPITIYVDTDSEAPYYAELICNSTGDIYAGDTISFTANAEDNIWITRVQLIVEGENDTEDYSAPFELNYQIPLFGNKTQYVFKAVAFDISGNMTESDPVTVDVIPFSGIEVEPQDGLINGETSLELYGTFADGRKVNITDKVDWSDRNNQIAIEFDNDNEGIFIGGKIYPNRNFTGSINFTVNAGDFSSSGTVATDYSDKGISDESQPDMGLDPETNNTDYGQITDSIEKFVDNTDIQNGDDDLYRVLNYDSNMGYRECSLESVNNGIGVFMMNYSYWGDNRLDFKYYNEQGIVEVSIENYIEEIHQSLSSMDSLTDNDGNIHMVYTYMNTGLHYAILNSGDYTLNNTELMVPFNGGGGDIPSLTTGENVLTGDGYDGSGDGYDGGVIRRLPYCPRIEKDNEGNIYIAWVEIEAQVGENLIAVNKIKFIKLDSEGNTVIPETEIYTFDIDSMELMNSSNGLLPDQFIRALSMKCDQSGNVHFTWLLSSKKFDIDYLTMYYKMLDPSGVTLIDTTVLSSTKAVANEGGQPEAMFTTNNVSWKEFRLVLDSAFDPQNKLNIMYHKVNDNGLLYLSMMKVNPSAVANPDGSSASLLTLVEEDKIIPGQKGQFTFDGSLKSTSQGIYGIYSEQYEQYSDERNISNFSWISEQILFSYGELRYNGNYYYEPYIDIYDSNIYIEAGPYTFELTYINYGKFMVVSGDVYTSDTGDGYSGYDGEGSVLYEHIDSLIMTRQTYEYQTKYTVKFFAKSDSVQLSPAKLMSDDIFYPIMGIDLAIDNSEFPFVIFDSASNENSYNRKYYGQLCVHAQFILGEGYESYGGGGGELSLKDGNGDAQIPTVADKPVIDNPDFESGKIDGYRTYGKVSVVKENKGLSSPQGTFMALIKENAKIIKDKLSIPANVKKLYFDISYLVESALLSNEDELPKVVATVTDKNNEVKSYILSDSAEETAGVFVYPYIMKSITEFKSGDSVFVKIDFTNPKMTKFKFDMLIEGLVDGENAVVNGLLNINYGVVLYDRNKQVSKYNIEFTNNSKITIAGPLKISLIMSDKNIKPLDAAMDTEFEVIALSKTVAIPVDDYAGTDNQISLSIFSDSGKTELMVDNFVYDNDVVAEKFLPYVNLIPCDNPNVYRSGYNVGGNINLSVEMYDFKGIDSVEIYVDGTLDYKVTDNIKPFGYTYNIKENKVGKLVCIKAKAIDVNGNVKWSKPAYFQVK